MVAIFTGYGAGVERGSTNILGGAGQLGGASHGRGGENVSVNAATGGLIISRRDEFLTGVGPDASVSRSYNSLVHTGDRDNGDNWQQSTTRRVFGLVGGVNSSGSTVQRLGADGSVINYEYATRDGEAAYWAIDGAGTHDKLEFDAGTDTWTWTDGDSLVQETYTLAYNQTAGHDPAVDGAGEFRLFGLEDRSGQKLTYSYEANSDRLHRITTENDNSISTDNEWIEYQWNADGTIARIDTGYRDLQNGNSDETLTRVYYGYDAQGRLSSVTTDLSPEDQAISDGNVYTISYEYVDTASNLISKISQADGSELAITYNADGRIATLTQKVDATDASQDRVTSLAYHIGYTIVTAPDGTDARLDYDAGGRLLQITTTAPGAGALSQIRQFEYDAEGNVTKVIETEGDASLLATTAATGGLVVEEVAVSTGDTGASGSSGTSSNDAAFAATGRGSNLSVVSLPEDLSEAPADGTLPEGWGGWNTVETNWKVVDAPYSASGTNDSLALNLTNLNGDTHSGRAEFAAPISLDSTKHHEYTFYFQHNSDAALRLNVRPDPYATDAQGNLVPTFKNAASGNLTVHQNMVDLYFNHANKPPVAQNKWYKAVVYILADGTPLLGSSKRGGIYDIETGAKLTDVNSLIWDENRVSDTASMRFRFSGLVGSDPAEGIKIWRPEIREVDPSAILVDDATLDVAVDAQLNGPPPPPVTYEGTGRGSNLSVVSLPEDLSEAPADGTLPEGWGGWNTVETNWKVVDAPYSASGTNDSLALNLTNLNGDTHSGRAEFAAPISLDSTKHHEYTFYFQHNSDAALRLNVRPDPYATDAQGNLVPTFKNAASGNLTVHQNMVDLYFNHANKPPVAQNKWYKAVVYILADGTPLLGSSKRGGIYDIETGAKLTDVNSLIWDENRVSDTASMRFRFSGLVGSDPAEGIKIWRPEIREVDPSAILVDDATLDVAVDAELNGIGGGAPSGGSSGGSGDPAVPGEYVPTGNVTGAPGVLYDVNGRATSYVYDSLGNVTQITDPNGNVVLRSYDANNQLETEQWTGSSASGSNVTSYAHNVYDTAGRLHYSVSAEGRVTEFRYTPAGQLLWTISYPESRYPDASQPVGSSAPTLGEMNAWRDGLDRSSSQMVMSEYDARGNLWRTTNFTSDSNGGVITAGNGGHYLQSYNTYDQAGQLLASYALGEAATVYDYDGLGRVKFSSDSAGNAMSVVFNDAGSETVITSAGGLVTTSTYNLAGELVTSTESSVAPSGTASTVLGIDNYAYDEMGRLAVFTDARGDRTFYLYDDLGRQTAMVTEDGWMTETRYDEANNIIATARYSATVSATDITAIASANHTKTVDQIRPAASAAADISQDVWTWAIYDDGNRLVQSISGDGAVTEFEYDEASNLIRTTAFWNKVDVATFDTNPPETALAITDNPANDIIIRNFYDKSGRQIGALDGEGYLTKTVYDDAGRVVAQTAYAGLTTETERANGSFETLLASPDVASQGGRTARSVYDGLGLLRYQIDSLGHVTGFTYDNAGKVTASTAYTNPISVSGDVLSPADVEQALPATPASTDRTITTQYDSAGRVASVTDPSGLVTSYTYGDYNNVLSVTRADGSDTRTTRNYYDAKGQLRFTLDPEGAAANEFYVSELIYDAEGNVVETRRYDSAITATATTSGSDVMGAVAGDVTAGRFATTTATFGNQGEVVSVSQKLNATETTTTNTQYTGTGATLRVDEAVGTLDAAGHVYYNDAVGRVTDSIHAHGQPEWITPRTTYDTFGRVASERDPELQTTSFEYNSRGLVTRVITPDTNDTEYEYNAFGEVVKVTDPRGHSTHTYYDDLGRVTHVVDAEGYVTHTTYTSFGEVATVTRYENKATGTATVSALPSIVTDANEDATTTFEYDNAGRLDKSIDAEGYVETYSYNAFGERVSMTGKSNTDTRVESSGNANVTTYAYDKRGFLVSETLPIQSYDKDGNALGAVVNSYSYDSRGNRIGMTEAVGRPEERSTTYVYDKANRLIRTEGQAREVYSQTDHKLENANFVPSETITYDARGNVTKTVDASGAVTIFYYDDLNRKVVEINALGTYTTYEYDDNSNVTRIRIFDTPVSVPANAATDANYVGGAKEEAPGVPSSTARETLFEYDALNRLTKSSVVGVHNGYFDGTNWVANANNFETLYQYDANGNVVKTTDPMGNETFAYYDRLSRKVAQIDAGGYLTTWDYDSESNVQTEIQYSEPVTNPIIGLVPVNHPLTDARITEYTYDEVGNRLTEKRLGIEVYDEVANNGASKIVDGSVSYTYNGLGQVLTKTEATGDKFTYQYDDGGRLTHERRYGDGLSYGFVAFDGSQVTPTVQYYYDGLGNLTRNRAWGASNTTERVTTYEYNTGGLLSRIVDAQQNEREYFYDASGRQIVEKYTRIEVMGATPLKEAVLTSYDTLGRVTEQKVAQDISSTSEENWQTDTSSSGNDEIINQTQYNAFGDVLRSGTNGIWLTENKYDLAGRLWATNAGDGIWKFFGYDKNGNQTIAITSAGEQFTSSTTFQQAFDGTGVTGSNGIADANINATYTRYDARNMAVEVFEEGRQLSGTSTADLTTTRSYNAFGEVASETDALGATLTYSYNTMGRMIRSESPVVSITHEDGTSQSVRPAEDYLYDASGRLLAQLDANGTYDVNAYDENGQLEAFKLKAAASGNLTRLKLLAGTGYAGTEALIVEQRAADDGITETQFNIHGEAREVIDQLGRTSFQEFDALGRLTKVTQPNGLVLNYEYDEQGQRIAEWNSLQGSSNKQTTKYDKHGRTIETRAFGGDVTQTSYDWDATLQAEGPGGAALTAAGGWAQTVSTIADRASTTDNLEASIVETDLFGRTVGRTATNGEVYSYEYDYAGRLIKENSVYLLGGALRKQNEFEYYNTGQLKEHVLGNNEVVDTTWRNKTATYGYDELGRLTSEKVASRAGDATSPWDFTALEDAYDEWVNRPPDGSNDGFEEPFETIPGDDGLGGSNDQWYDVYFESYSLNELKDILINNELGSPPWDGDVLDPRPIISFQFLDAFAPTPQPIEYTITSRTLQDGHVEYDALGRMTRYVDDATSGVENVVKTWAYDANSNVRRIITDYRPMTITGTLSTSTQSQTLWYAYDKMNRMTVANGSHNGSAITIDANSTLLSYDKVGNRKTAKTGTKEQENYSYDSAGNLTKVTIGAYVRGETSYDLLGRITGHIERASNNTLTHERYDIVYNDRGQIIAEKSKTKTSGGDWRFSHIANYYSADGTGGDPSDITSTASKGSSTGTLLYHSENKQWQRSTSSGTPSYSTSSNNEDDAVPDSFTTYTYRWADTAQQYQINVRNEHGQANTFHGYDLNDQLVRAGTGGGYNPHTKHYENTMDGQILERTETSSNQPNDRPSLRAYYFGGQRLGEITNNGTANTDYATSVDDRVGTEQEDPGPYRGGATSGTVHADFGLAYTAINGSTHQEGAGGYTARGGENLQQVASALWGNANLWYKLAQANGLSAGTTLYAGQTIRIPAGVQANQHNASTIAPYNPAEAIGDTQPGTPLPPKGDGNKCGTFGLILLAVVAVAVTVITSGALAAASLSAVGGTNVTLGAGLAALAGSTATGAAITTVGAITIGATAAAAGSIVSQAVGVATGIQQKFSWKGVALSAIGGAVGSAVGSGGVLSNIKSGVVRAGVGGAIGSAATQGVAVATGLQSSFNWAGVAAAGIGGAVGYLAGGAFGTKPLDGAKILNGTHTGDHSFSNHLAHAATRAASTIANAATRSALNGTSFSRSIEAAIPDTIAQTIGDIAKPLFRQKEQVEATPVAIVGFGYKAFAAGIPVLGIDDIQGPTIVVIGHRDRRPEPGSFDEWVEWAGDGLENLLDDYRIDATLQWNIDLEVDFIGLDIETRGNVNISGPLTNLNVNAIAGFRGTALGGNVDGKLLLNNNAVALRANGSINNAFGSAAGQLDVRSSGNQFRGTAGVAVESRIGSGSIGIAVQRDGQTVAAAVTGRADAFGASLAGDAQFAASPTAIIANRAASVSVGEATIGFSNNTTILSSGAVTSTNNLVFAAPLAGPGTADQFSGLLTNTTTVNTSQPVPQVRLNYQSGKAFENQLYNDAVRTFGQSNVAQNVSIRAYRADGKLATGRTVADLLINTGDVGNPSYLLVEAKLHDQLRLSRRQNVHYPLVQQNGLQIRGNNALGLEPRLRSGDTLTGVNYRRIDANRFGPYFYR